jgi:hypothetical protein
VQQLTFMDGLLQRMAAAVDPRTTLLLVTGDHGMAARGTHGGEEEARLTPTRSSAGRARGREAGPPANRAHLDAARLARSSVLAVSTEPPMPSILAERGRLAYARRRILRRQAPSRGDPGQPPVLADATRVDAEPIARQ